MTALLTNYGFGGMEWDTESSLYHTWFRQYDPAQGRWMSVDPLAGSPDDPQSLNRYVYVVDDPANFTDPLGLEHDCRLYVWRCYGEKEKADGVYCQWEGYFCGGGGGGGSGGGGDSGGGAYPPQPPMQRREDCPSRLASRINEALISLLPFAGAARDLARLTGRVVQVGIGGSAAIPIRNELFPGLAASVEGSVSLAFDRWGNIALAVSYGAGGGFGGGGIVGGQGSISRARTVFDLAGPAISVGGAIGAGRAVGAQGSSTGGGTLTLTVGGGTGAFIATSSAFSNTRITPLACQ